jgi:signal peptidase II
MFLGAAADLHTKRLAFSAVAEGESSPVIGGYFDISPAMNPGAAFGLLKGETIFFLIISMAALAMIASYMFLYRDKSIVLPAALGLISAGVLGNFFDRVAVSGGVRDFIHLHWKDSAAWPTFNVADTLITVGVILIFIRFLFFKKRSSEPAEPYESGESICAIMWVCFIVSIVLSFVKVPVVGLILSICSLVIAIYILGNDKYKIGVKTQAWIIVIINIIAFIIGFIGGFFTGLSQGIQ